MIIMYFPVIVSLFVIAFSSFLIVKIIKAPLAKSKTRVTSGVSFLGSVFYLKRQYRIASIIVLALFLILLTALGLVASFGFLIGAMAAAFLEGAGLFISNYIDMKIAASFPKGNAKSRKLVTQALDLLFNASLAMGLLGGSLGLLLVSGYYFLTGTTGLIALVFGVVVISFLSKINHGLRSNISDELVIMEELPPAQASKKASDVLLNIDASSVKKIKNHAGDLASVSMNVFEAYVLGMVVAMMLGTLLYPNSPQFTLLPLFLASVLLLASIIVSFFTRVLKNRNSMSALYQWSTPSILLPVLAFYPVISNIMVGQNILPFNIYLCCIIGLLVTVMIFLISKYRGFASTLKAFGTVLALIVVAAASSFLLAGIYGLALVGLAMLFMFGVSMVVYFSGRVKEEVLAILKIHMLVFEGLMAISLLLIYLQQFANISGTRGWPMGLDMRMALGLFFGGMASYAFLGLFLKNIKKNTSNTPVKGVLALFLIPLAAPVFIGFLLGAQGVLGLLAGSLGTGLVLAIAMNTGATLLSAIKKRLEAPKLGGKNGFAYQSAILIESHKDSMGFAINSANTVLLLAVSLMVAFLV